MVAWNDYTAIATERGALAHEVYVVDSTPKSDPDAVKAALPDHLAYLRGLEESGALMMAGPVSDASGNEMEGAGMLVLRAKSMAQAANLADNDPMHKTGARTYSLKKWLINEGSLHLTVGLSSRQVRLS